MPRAPPVMTATDPAKTTAPQWCAAAWRRFEEIRELACDHALDSYQLRIGEITLLVVRPDGHVGLRADRDHIAFVRQITSCE